MEYGEEMNINYDAIKELHDHAEFLECEMHYIMTDSHHQQKNKAQAIVLHSVCSTIVTFTTDWLENTYEWDTFVVDLMGCYYLLYSVYTSRVLELRDVLEVCENSDEAWASLEWIIDVLGDFGQSRALMDRDTWMYGK